MAEGAIVWDPYIDWAMKTSTPLRRLAEKGVSIYIPVFFTCEQRPQKSALRRLIDGQQGPADQLSRIEIPTYERHILGLDTGNEGPIGDDHFFVHVAIGFNKGRYDFGTLHQVLEEAAAPELSLTAVHFGQPFPIIKITATDAENTPFGTDHTADYEGRPDRSPVIVAVIDDRISTKHERFYSRIKDTTQSRFEGIWYQNFFQLQNAQHGTGIVLARGHARPQDRAGGIGISESTAFLGQLTGAGVSPDLRSFFPVSIEENFAHGTAVLDLAAGYDPQACPKQAPLLMAVQLPGLSVQESEGSRFVSYILMGLRWLLYTARHQPDGISRSIVINISMGMMAGAKNGTAFLPYYITKEIEAFNAASKAELETNKYAPCPLAFATIAFGNDFRSQQHVEFRLTPKHRSAEIDWIVLPDDKGANVIEVYVQAKNQDAQAQERVLQALKVELVSPLDKGTVWPLKSPTQWQGACEGAYSAAILYSIPPKHIDISATDGRPVTTPPFKALVLPGTAGQHKGDPVVPAGRWRLTITLDSEICDTVHLSLYIQRGDNVPGYSAGREQSYFDATNAYDWDQRRDGFVQHNPSGPIVHEGTDNLISTIQSKYVFSVNSAVRKSYSTCKNGQGAARCNRYKPADYASQGTAERQPDFSAIADEGYAVSGSLAAGFEPSSYVRLSGTSAAAPKIARALAELSQDVAFRRAYLNGDQSKLFTALNLYLTPVTDETLRQRLGFRVYDADRGKTK